MEKVVSVSIYSGRRMVGRIGRADSWEELKGILASRPNSKAKLLEVLNFENFPNFGFSLLII